MSKAAVRTARETTIAKLQPLMTKALSEMLFFRSRYKGVTMTPEKLQEEHSRGRYIWGPEHWHLIDATGKRVV